MDGFCNPKDSSNLVNILSVVKSERELKYVRRVSEFADYALDEAYKLVKPGCDEGDLLDPMQGVIFRGGRDYPANEFIIGLG